MVRRFLRSACVWLCNLLWVASCVPGWLAFRLATRAVRKTQERVLRRILRRNRDTAFGVAHCFRDLSTAADYAARVPLSEHADYADGIAALRAGAQFPFTAEPVLLLEPTSGSMSGTKLIPYTASLRREFQMAIGPWIAGLYLRRPRLLGGRHYWSLSPSTTVPDSSAEVDAVKRVPVGFADDAEYLGLVQRRLARLLFAVPPDIRRVSDRDTFDFITLLFLVAEKNLRLISVWHPSFLTVLLGRLPALQKSIVDALRTGQLPDRLRLPDSLRASLQRDLRRAPERADEVAAIEFGPGPILNRIWPRLQVISCWTEGQSEREVRVLRGCFPGVLIEGKGLTATEGIVSFPIGCRSDRVCALRSHFLEFIDADTQSVHPAWELVRDREYSIVLTTGGGLYRYRLHDRVRVTGYHSQAPCLEFLSREGKVVDLVGEKLHAEHVSAVLAAVSKQLGVQLDFAMLAPLRQAGVWGYVLFCRPSSEEGVDWVQMMEALERELQANYHYRHARNLGQLAPLRAFLVAGDAVAVYRDRCASMGMRLGDIKLLPLRAETDWADVFQGQLV